MIYNETILKYKMTKQDKALAEMADTVLRAYDDSLVSHTDLYDGEDVKIKYHTLHSPEGYSFALFERGIPRWIYTTDAKLSDYIHHVFLTKGGISNAGKLCSWNRILESTAVISALREKYNTDTLEVMYLYEHSRFGICLVCAERIDGAWQDGWYNIGRSGNLRRLTQAR